MPADDAQSFCLKYSGKAVWSCVRDTIAGGLELERFQNRKLSDALFKGVILNAQDFLLQGGLEERKPEWMGDVAYVQVKGCMIA
jgi:hypothetical protein